MAKERQKEEEEILLEKLQERILKDLPLNPHLSMHNVQMLYTHAYSLYQVGNYREAEEIFAELVRLKPLHSTYWFGLGSCLQAQKKYAEALDLWSMAAILDPENPAPCFHAAECYFSLSLKDEGMRALSDAKKRLNSEKKEWEEKISALQANWK